MLNFHLCLSAAVRVDTWKGDRNSFVIIHQEDISTPTEEHIKDPLVNPLQLPLILLLPLTSLFYQFPSLPMLFP